MWSFCNANTVRNTLECFWVLLLILANSVALILTQHRMETALKAGDTEQLLRATLDLQSATRTIIYITKAGSAGLPIDFDTLAFWSHYMAYLGGLMHIKYGIRDENWAADVEYMIDYLRYLAPRYKLYSMLRVRKVSENQLTFSR